MSHYRDLCGTLFRLMVKINSAKKLISEKILITFSFLKTVENNSFLNNKKKKTIENQFISLVLNPHRVTITLTNYI